MSSPQRIAADYVKNAGTMMGDEHVSTTTLLRSMTYRELQKEAKTHGIAPKQKKEVLLAQILAAAKTSSATGAIAPFILGELAAEPSACAP
jgi:hypothetical protein